MIAKQVLEVVGEDPAYSQLRDAVNRPRLLLTEKPDEWLATWREELQNFGIFTLSNCWHNEKTPSVNCEQCGRSVKLDKDKCENSESHPGSSHQESFEDAVKDDSEPLEIAGKSKTKNVFELLSSNPDPSPKFEEFLKKVDNWFNPKA